MAQKAKSKKHAAQIKAGISGRRKGHLFEKALTKEINSIAISNELFMPMSGHLFMGMPSQILVQYILHNKNLKNAKKIQAFWLGGLATSGEGDSLYIAEKEIVGKSKSDVGIKIETPRSSLLTGVSVKTCNTDKPTNAQLFFTTASAFCRLLRDNRIPVSSVAEEGMKMFCGDVGWRPIDFDPNIHSKRKSDPDHWFFEELPLQAQEEWRNLLTKYQKQVTIVLLQKAYPEDPLPPEFILHQTIKSNNPNQYEIALFSIDQIAELSCKYAGFETPQYFVRKGRFKGDPNPHLAPRFGYIQFQRGGQKQHPTQLQFNLQAGYFYKLPDTKDSK